MTDTYELKTIEDPKGPFFPIIRKFFRMAGLKDNEKVKIPTLAESVAA